MGGAESGLLGHAALADELERLATGRDREDRRSVAATRRTTLALEALTRRHLLRESGACISRGP